MIISATPSDDDIFAALRTFVLTFLPSGGAIFSASIAASIATVSAVTQGTISAGDAFLGDNVKPGTLVVGQITPLNPGEAAGGIGRYNLSIDQGAIALPTSIYSTGVEVMQGQYDRVPEPKAPDFITMVVLRLPRLATNVDTFDKVVQIKTIMRSGEWTLQLDLHGPNSANFAQIISTLFRDEVGVDTFTSINPAISPLHADVPRQAPFLNAEQAYENRYILEVTMQVDQTFTVTQQSATSIVVDPYSVNHPPLN